MNEAAWLEERLRDIQIVEVVLKMFMLLTDGKICQWFLSLFLSTQILGPIVFSSSMQ